MSLYEIFYEQVRVMRKPREMFFYLEYPKEFSGMQFNVEKIIYPMTKRDKIKFLDKYDWDGTCNGKLPRLYIK